MVNEVVSYPGCPGFSEKRTSWMLGGEKRGLVHYPAVLLVNVSYS